MDKDGSLVGFATATPSGMKYVRSEDLRLVMSNFLASGSRGTAWPVLPISYLILGSAQAPLLGLPARSGVVIRQGGRGLEAGDFVFRTYPSDALAGRINARYAYEKLGARKAAVFTELTDYAQGLREVYKTSFQEFGGEIVADETYNTGDVDFRTQVLKIKSKNPDIIYVVPQSPTPGVAIFKQLREAGVKAQFTTAEVLLDRQVVKDNAKALEGVIGVEVAVDYDNNPKANSLRTAHRAKFNSDPGSFAANAYDAVYLIRDAILEKGLNTGKIRDWLYSVKNWMGSVGAITIDKNGDPVMGENVRKISGGAVSDLGSYAP